MYNKLNIIIYVKNNTQISLSTYIIYKIIHTCQVTKNPLFEFLLVMVLKYEAGFTLQLD